MGLQLPKRNTARTKRVAMGAMLGALLMSLSACGDAWTKDQWANFAMPDPITSEAHYTFDLWRGAWVAALITGAIVWGLIFYVMWRYRRRSDDEIPVQTRYNLPLEVFYTIAPVLMVIVMFFHTVKVQDVITNVDPDPDVTIEVLGQQWTWTFNHGIGEQHAAEADPENGEWAYDEYAYTSGDAGYIPTLVLPVDELVQFNLHSPDVIHSFGVPAFLTKLDVIPGRINKMQVTPTVEGTFPGKCFELCGESHSRMLFNVKVVSQEDYAAYVKQLQASGDVSDDPVLGGDFVNHEAGLDEDTQEGTQE